MLYYAIVRMFFGKETATMTTTTQRPRASWQSRPTPRRQAPRRSVRATRLSRRALLTLVPVATFVALSDPSDREPDTPPTVQAEAGTRGVG